MNALKMLAATAVLGMIVGLAPAKDYYVPPDFDGRVGAVVFENTSHYTLYVSMWHPDSGEKFGTWKIYPGERILFTYQGKDLYVGSDWGIQIGSSEIKPISDVALWRPHPETGRMWYLDVDLFHQ